MVFVMLVTSFIGMPPKPYPLVQLQAKLIVTGVVTPILLAGILPKKAGVVFIIIKQFGTGVIVSTAFVHVRL